MISHMTDLARGLGAMFVMVEAAPLRQAACVSVSSLTRATQPSASWISLRERERERTEHTYPPVGFSVQCSVSRTDLQLAGESVEI